MKIPNSTSDNYSGAGSSPILATKLYRPPVTSDLVTRTSLLELLSENRHRPLTLISAPAGYGKSTLASMWLDTSDSPSAWISLDKYDNDLSTFVSYILAALSRMFPSIQLQAWNLIESPVLAPAHVIARHILNDLEQIDEPFILVLDDVYMIHEQPIFELLGELLRYPSRNMHLVLVTRRDPPLPISSMRARRQVTEIRSHHLRVTVPEARSILTRVLHHEIDETTAAKWTERTEGWVTALQLAALYVAHSDRDFSSGADTPAGGRYLQDYLVAEVLEHLDPALRQRLLATSLLDRFCGSLCEAVWPIDAASDEGAFTGPQFIEWLHDHNLFLIQLDDDYHWFRFHHVFQNLLQKLLRDGTESDEIANIQRRASQWYAENGLIDEAIRHAQAASDIDLAMNLVLEHRYELMNSEQWRRLNRWLEQLPINAIEQNAYLCSARAFFGLYIGQDLSTHMRVVEDLLSTQRLSDKDRRVVHAELSVLHGVRAVSKGQADKAIACGQRSLEQLPPNALHIRGLSHAVELVGLQMRGEFSQAVKEFRRIIADSDWPRHSRASIHFYFSICCYMEGELDKVIAASLECQRLGQEGLLAASVSFSRYFLGAAYYLRNELTLSESQLRTLIKEREFSAPSYVAQGMFLLASIYMKSGRSSDARNLFEVVRDQLRQNDSSFALWTMEAAEVELSLREGDLDEARRKSDSFTNFDRYPPTWFWYVPQLTPVKLLLANGTPESLAEARAALASMDEQMGKIHRNSVRIDVLCLLSLVCDAQGEESEACDRLAEAIALAEPGGFIRNFVDLGQPMADLLAALRVQQSESLGDLAPFIDQIWAAFPAQGPEGTHEETSTSASGLQSLVSGLPDPLTERELQVLRLLATELSPEEIGEELVVSTATVRAHTKNVYRKLDVHSRFEAVQLGKDRHLI